MAVGLDDTQRPGPTILILTDILQTVVEEYFQLG